MHLVIANKLYSSWSMRPWLVMTAFAIPFEETVIPLRVGGSAERIRSYSPSGKVPVLIDGEAVVWESVAIIEHLAERYPDRAIWPKDPVARAHARSIASEMHAGFQALRQACPMNLGKRFKTPELSAEVAAAIARIEELWQTAHGRFAGRGPFLFGAFCAADAMYAPVATRFDTYRIPVSAASHAYMEALLSHPAVCAWREAALDEPWTIADYETGFEPVETLRRSAA